MPRFVTVEAPSFPQALTETPLPVVQEIRWQVLCGDQDHWRAGIYSPAETSASQILELEQHSCPELFLLIEGEVTLLVADQAGSGLREIPLEPCRPVLVTAPHAGFCPKGPHTGKAFVVERDAFSTEYRESLAR